MITTRELIVWFVVICLSAQAVSGFVIYFLIMRKVRNLYTNPIDINPLLSTLVEKITNTYEGVAKASDALVAVGKQLEQVYNICPLGRGDASKPKDC